MSEFITRGLSKGSMCVSERLLILTGAALKDTLKVQNGRIQLNNPSFGEQASPL